MKTIKLVSVTAATLLALIVSAPLAAMIALAGFVLWGEA